MKRLVQSVVERIRRHGPELAGSIFAAAAVVVFQSPLGALVRVPISIIKEEALAHGRRRRRRLALGRLSKAAADVVEAPLLARGRPELRFWRPNWKVNLGTLADEGFDGVPGSDETWRHLYAAVAEDLAALHRGISANAFAELSELDDKDRAVVGRLLTSLAAAIAHASEMSGLSAESGWRWHAKADDPLTAHRESEPVLAIHRQVYPLWRNELRAAVASAAELHALAGRR